MAVKIVKSDKEWQTQLTPEQNNVTREAGTERAFTGAFHDCKDKGIYKCICCDQPLFSSDTKFDSGTGWPSYTNPIADEAVDEHEDNSFFSRRTEVVCSRCDSHLGHVFPDGPEPTGLRICINSASLAFEADGEPKI